MLESYSQQNELIDISRKKDVVNLITHALLSGIVVDIMSNTFKNWSKEEIIDWFPKYKKQSEREGSECETEEPKDIYPDNSSETSIITEYIFYFLDKDKWTIENEKRFKQENLYIVDAVLQSILIRLENKEYKSFIGNNTYNLILRLTYTLIETGYFGYQDLQVLFETCDEKLAPYFEDLLNNYFDFDFYNEFYSVAIKDNQELDEDQLILLEVVFYLARISTQYKGIKFTTVPKETLPEVFTTQSDIGLVTFLFAIWCIFSEQYGKQSQYRLIVPEKLCKESPYAEDLKDLIKTIIL
ncbi:MAG TPA: hypothetical protein VKR58_05905 [Aquella sp.]|nr:hypothetical protein [Aquella sp.]